MNRTAGIKRKTGETDIEIKINLDGMGNYDISTGIGFFDHLLALLARHGFFDLNVRAAGDLHVDSHHTVEDVGIVLGQAIKEAMGDKKSIRRYGFALMPMDETLCEVALDLGGRSFLVFNADFKYGNIGQMQSQMVEEFFRALAYNAGMTLHINVKYGKNDHHIAEAIFKAFARALDMAVSREERLDGVLSTKGTL